LKTPGSTDRQGEASGLTRDCLYTYRFCRKFKQCEEQAMTGIATSNPVHPKRAFRVEAVWDAEAGVYYSQSDIVGLHIEAATLGEFRDLMEALAPELLVANHIDPKDLGRVPLQELIPSWYWEKPDAAPVAA
jgi:hypothetical protein